MFRLVFLVILASCLVGVKATECVCTSFGCDANANLTGCAPNSTERFIKFVAFSTDNRYRCGNDCSDIFCQIQTKTRGYFITRPESVDSHCNGPCFHESTVIQYRGETFTLRNISHHCVVPHIVPSYGHSMTVQCQQKVKVIRATSDHLFFTRRGIVPLQEITTTDMVFSDLEETEECLVLKNEKETIEQVYFGLNCFESVVLASGIKASTFGRNHMIPATWMWIMSRVFGLEKASCWGEVIVSYF